MLCASDQRPVVDEERAKQRRNKTKPPQFIYPTGHEHVICREKPHLPEYQIVVDDVTGGEIANIIRGYIKINGEKIRFKGIAYGRYGGQNVAPGSRRSRRRE